LTALDDRPIPLNAPPGPKGCPFAGSLPALAWNVLRFFEYVTARYGDITLFKLGRKKVYLISHPKDIATLFTDERKGAYSRQFFHDAYCPAFGNGVFNSYGDTWKRQRQILQPYFNKRAIAAWFPIIHQEAEQAVQRLLQKSAGSVQVEKEVLPLVQAIMSRILFGQSLQDEDSRQAIAAINTVSQHTMTRSIFAFIFNGFINRLPTPGNRRYQRALVLVDQSIDNLRRKAAQCGVNSSLLAKIASEFGPKELRDHLFTLFFGGQDTTVNAIAFTLYYLGQHPDLQQRARDEVNAVIAENGSLNYPDLAQLQFTESVINESMRLLPPAYASYRDVIGDQQLRDKRIESQSIVVFAPYMTHRHPAFWPEPERFDPERFMNDKPLEKFAFIPYGGGMRTCLGLNLARVEILTVVAMLLPHVRWTLPANFQTKFIPHMTLKSRKGITINFEEVA
jgi:enediyne biosynthesis protein E7